MGRKSVIAYTIDRPSDSESGLSVDQYVLTGDVKDVGQIYSEVERDQYEFASGDASFEVSNGEDLHSALKADRKLAIEVVKDRDVLFLGDMKVEGTEWDPENETYKFYAVQRTKAFIDAAALTPVWNPATNVADIIMLNMPKIPVTEVTGNLAEIELAATAPFKLNGESLSGKYQEGNIGDFGAEYDYMVRDFILDVCRFWGGAYWVDEDNVLHIQQRYKPQTIDGIDDTIDGLDDKIAGYTSKLRDPKYAYALVRLGWQNVARSAAYPNIYIMTPDGHTDQVRMPSLIRQLGPRSMSDAIDRGTYLPWGALPAMDVKLPTGDALQVDVPSKYDGYNPIFFYTGQSIEAMGRYYLPLLGVQEEATIKFNEIVPARRFQRLRLRGTNYLITKVLHDIVEETTSVIGEIIDEE